jgi:hypothetical protein
MTATIADLTSETNVSNLTKSEFEPMKSACSSGILPTIALLAGLLTAVGAAPAMATQPPDLASGLFSYLATGVSYSATGVSYSATGVSYSATDVSATGVPTTGISTTGVPASGVNSASGAENEEPTAAQKLRAAYWRGRTCTTALCKSPRPGGIAEVAGFGFAAFGGAWISRRRSG